MSVPELLSEGELKTTSAAIVKIMEINLEEYQRTFIDISKEDISEEEKIDKLKQAEDITRAIATIILFFVEIIARDEKDTLKEIIITYKKRLKSLVGEV